MPYNNLYSMPATHPAVHQAVEELIAAGAPANVEFYDYEDPWGYWTHEVHFHNHLRFYSCTAGLLTQNLSSNKIGEHIAFTEMKALGMITPTATAPPPFVAPAPPAPTAQVLIDDVVGAPDPNRPGLYEPSPGTNPYPGATYATPDGRNWVALQVAFGFGGASVNMRWKQLPATTQSLVSEQRPQ
ncbi:MAG: hypothetical protein NVS9B12_14030 [Vulcanimicrobiaceae bacterium]